MNKPPERFKGTYHDFRPENSIRKNVIEDLSSEIVNTSIIGETK